MVAMDKFKNLKVPFKEREPFIYLEMCKLDVSDGSIKHMTKDGTCYYPCGSFCCILFGPGCSITHEVAKILHKTSTLGVFVGQGGTRLYNAMGMHSPNSNKKILEQANLYVNKRTFTARKIYCKMLNVEGDDLEGLSLGRMRGIEGQYVRGIYRSLSKKYNIPWTKRDYGISDYSDKDAINTALNIANTCLYSFCESVILAYGAAPQIGFIHNVSKNSLALDLADIYKFKLFTPLVFKYLSGVRGRPTDIEQLSFSVRRIVRRSIVKNKISDKLFRDLNDILC